MGRMTIGKDNRGITLIELIVVLAIVAVFSTGGISIYQQISYADPVKAAQQLNSTINNVRNKTMTGSEKLYLYLYCIDGTCYMKTSTESTFEEAALTSDSGTRLTKKLSLSYRIEPDIERQLENDNPVRISFARSSGRFDQDISYIKLSSPNSAAIIKCVRETGRHWVEDR